MQLPFSSFGKKNRSASEQLSSEINVYAQYLRACMKIDSKSKIDSKTRGLYLLYGV